MSVDADPGEQPRLSKLIARAPSVREYCAELSPAELVDEATLAAFVDFLGRVRAAPAAADPDDLLRKSTRLATAARMWLPHALEPACRDTAELLAARANGELPYDEHAISQHLERCGDCKRTVQRLAQAEDAFIRAPAQPPPEEIRTAWLELASRDLAQPPPEITKSEPPAPARVRARRGGPAGAARRLASSARRR